MLQVNRDLNGSSASKTWLRALEMTARIDADPLRTLPAVIEELGARFGAAPALLSEHEAFTHAHLAARADAYAKWALAQDIGRGDVVGLLMPNCAEYLAIWLGITRIGGVVALLNTNLTGRSLAHCIQVAGAKQLIVAPQFEDAILAVADDCVRWTHDDAFSREIDGFMGGPRARPPQGFATLNDRALLIYTSGTTGLPKAACVSHHRLMMWSHWFAGLMAARQSDRLYNCLPMYHSVGGVVASCAVLLAGGSVVLRQRFSASGFWTDIAQSECTIFQYIGELCRYLLKSELPHVPHRLRLACGNGLAGDIWTAFQQRFAIPQILEFYASSEGNFSLFNVEGRPGSIGRIPPVLGHRLAPAIVKFDTQTGAPMRGPGGHCMAVARGEIGEAIGRIAGGAARFEGYTDAEATKNKILRDVFEADDAWMRTGDLMRQDGQGFYYFVDRVGDTFRWKGENVATTEVAAAFTDYPGVRAATVYGVGVPGADGRAGMAALETGAGFDVAELREHLRTRLPDYACPLFLRLVGSLAITETFKQKKHALADEGFDPARTGDALYCNLGAGYVPLNAAIYNDIRSGRMRF